MFPDTVASTLAVGDKAQGRSGERTFPLVLEYLSTRSDNGSLVQAIERAETEGLNVVQVLTLVDRQEGAVETLAAKGYELHVLFTRAELEQAR